MSSQPKKKKYIHSKCIKYIYFMIKDVENSLRVHFQEVTWHSPIPLSEGPRLESELN